MNRPGALLLLGTAMLAFVATDAAAQKIDPRCQRMFDKIGCTCALENGGYITRLGTWTANKPGRTGTNSGTYLNEEFYRCNMRHKGKKG